VGTINFTVGRPGRTSRHVGAGAVMGKVSSSGAYTTSTSATNIEDGAGDISIRPGEYFEGTASEDMWITPYGTAAVGTGVFFPANTTAWLEYDPDFSAGVKAAAFVSAIDVA